MSVRRILIASCSAALLAAPAAMAHRGGDDDKGKPEDRSGKPAQTTTAPALPNATAVACAPKAEGQVSYSIKGKVLSVSASGVQVRVLKANGNFRRAAGAGKSFGLYDAPTGASEVAEVLFGDCTRVKGLRFKGNHGRKKGVRSLDAASCVQAGSAVRSWKKSGVICVGNLVEVQWKAAPNANIGAGGLGAPRKIDVKR